MHGCFGAERLPVGALFLVAESRLALPYGQARLPVVKLDDYGEIRACPAHGLARGAAFCSPIRLAAATTANFGRLFAPPEGSEYTGETSE